jgi:type II secretory pathway pseudopilin PulG
MNSLNILIPMQLRGQARPDHAGECGYAMAVLLMALSVMAILMTIAMPVWKHDAQREKEAELVFRGEQYGRALTLFQRKRGPGVTPPNVQALLDDHVLRKLYKDPITGDDFDIVRQGQQAAGITQSPASGRGGTSATAPQGSSTSQPGAGPGTPSSNGPVGGIFGFASKSKAESIRIYKGHTHYNEWLFTATQLAQTPGAGAPGSNQPGGPQGPGGIPVGGPGRGGPGRGGPSGVGPGGRGITIGPNGQVIGPNGQPIVDPRTGQPITVTPGGRAGQTITVGPGGRGRGN